MSTSHHRSSDLHSVVLPEGAVILGPQIDARARSTTERYVLERLRNGESLGCIARELMVLEHPDVESAQRAVDAFTSSLLERRQHGDPDMLREWVGL